MKKPVAALLLILVCALPAQAGIDRWTHTLEGTGAHAVAVDPVDRAIAYAATDAGVFRTNDAGRTWTIVLESQAFSIAINPLDRATVVAAIDRSSDSHQHLQWSDDRGTTWRKVHPFTFDEYITGLAFDRLQPATLYVSGYDAGVSKTADRGATWRTLFYGIGPPSRIFLETEDVATSGIASQTLFAASGSLLVSGDGGLTWQSLVMPGARPGGSFSFEPRTITIDPTNASRLYMTGIFPYHGPLATFTSADDGLSWKELPLGTMHRITVDPGTPTTLYSSSSNGGRGVLRSADRGRTWNEFNDGLTNADVHSVSTDATGTLLYATTTVGVFTYEIGRKRLRGVSK